MTQFEELQAVIAELKKNPELNGVLKVEFHYYQRDEVRKLETERDALRKELNNIARKRRPVEMVASQARGFSLED